MTTPASPSPRSRASSAGDEHVGGADDESVPDEARVLAGRTPEQRTAARAARERRHEQRRRRRRVRRVRRVLIIVLVVLALVATTVLVWLRYTFGGLERIPGALPEGADTPGTTILLVAADPGAHDRVAAGPRWRQALEHSDLVMLVHLPADRADGVFAVSVPGSVTLPGTGRLGSTAAAGGAAYVRALERTTGVHIDRLAVWDLNAVREIVDELDGVTVSLGDGCAQAGAQRLDGQGALEVMRLRPCLPRGDLDRVARQQAVLRAVLARTLDGGALVNPLRLNRVAKSTFDHLAVNADWSLWDIARTAWSLRGTTPRSTTFLTAPTRRTHSGLVLDHRRAAELWQALRSDRLGEYVALNRDVVAGSR